MRIPDRARKGLVGAVVVMGGLLAGTAVSMAMDAARDEPSDPRALTLAEYNEAAYDRATVRFTGRLGPRALAAGGALPFEQTVLVVLRGGDIAKCEDLGRQLRELYRALPDRPGWGIAVLTDPAAEAELRRFLARERIPSVTVLAGAPDALLAGGTKVATPAALIAGRDGAIRAGVSHPSRFKNMRGRSFAQELPLHDAGSP